jgi:hypothetical protein
MGERNLSQFVNLTFLDRRPLLFAIAKEMTRRKIRGGGRLFTILERLGYLRGKVVKYQLKENYCVYVPTYRPERWDRLDLLEYEPDLVSALVDAASECAGPLTIIDCGADIGLISVAIAERLNRIIEVLAF